MHHTSFHFRAALAGVVAALLPAASPGATISTQAGGGYPSASMGARADWTSDNGPDYQFVLGNLDDSGYLAGGGEGTYQLLSGPVPYAAPNPFALNWRLDSKGGGAGDTYSGGNATNNFGGTVSPLQISSFHLYSVLGDNNPGWGISTNAWLQTYFIIDSDFNNQPIYWALAWNVQVQTTGWTSVGVSLEGVDSRNGDTYYPARVLYTGTTESGSSAGVSGGDYGMEQWYLYSPAWSIPPLRITTYIGDTAGAPGSGTVDVTVWLAFSTTPITNVPEPAALPMLAVVLPAGLLLRRCRLA